MCRYGFPHQLLRRGGNAGMNLEKGDREGQWHARFPRNDRLCCSYEAHVLLANLGNVDWRPCLNLWAVVQYVTKYAAKAPKGSRRLNEVLHDAVDEVCRYVPEGEGADFRWFANALHGSGARGGPGRPAPGSSWSHRPRPGGRSRGLRSGTPTSRGQSSCRRCAGCG